MTQQLTNSSGTPLSGASITVKDSTGAVVYTGSTGSSGKITTDVTQYYDTNISNGTVVSREMKFYKTPHTITVTANGKTVSKAVSVSGNQTVQMVL